MAKKIKIRPQGQNVDGSFEYRVYQFELFDGSRFGTEDVVHFENDVDADFFLDKHPYYLSETSEEATIKVPPFHPMPKVEAVPVLDLNLASAPKKGHKK